MPTLELATFLEYQLEENPLLELSEPQAEDGEPSRAESNAAEENRPVELDEAWLSHWQTNDEREEPDDEESRGPDQFGRPRLTTQQSLYEALRLQLGCQQLSEEERRLGELLIDHLNQCGYLEDSLEDLSAHAGASVKALEAALRMIQRFDPPGVGARDLRECLMIQLEQREADDALAYRILKDHFQLFVQHRIGGLEKATGGSLEQVEKSCAFLKQLNPKPGSSFSGDLPPSIIPDLIVHHRERHYDVELNEQDLPHIAISRSYYRMLKDPRTPQDAKEFLTEKFRKAGWLIKAIDERNTTILSIARCLISLQRDFIEQGSRALKPLTQAQVASLIGRHPSTVSRAISGKTIDTPYGVFRLEQLFAGEVRQTSETSSVSDETIKSEIQRLIDQEDRRRPLSDAALVKHLSQGQISVARRTIAKYRTSLKILPAHLRKHR